MSDQPALANQLFLSGDWAVTVAHVLLDGAEVDALVVSKGNLHTRTLYRLSFYPPGEIPVPRRSAGIQIYVKGDEQLEWGKLFLPTSTNGEISPELVYKLLNKASARNLLSGHLLTYFYHPLMRMKEQNPHIDVASRWDRELRFVLANNEETLTSFTASVYRALTDWLESSPAQLIALMEGVSVTTIRNRLHAARESGILQKPGAGKRSAKRITPTSVSNRK